MDNEMLSKDQLFPDNFAKREILSLTVRCANSGCGEKMELRNLEVRIFKSDRHFSFSFQFNHEQGNGKRARR